ncbi:copper chaperone PCu(A)C [Aliikangiella marina]|uniref:Copper chaperone PCu(A)C n=1 Tax=Aliikangiella marina TaxID=1712262 RepID=A0A545TH27_9GAMM|nr:copper chaperone PCu(A)C [Aliikangiella marina]TQV76527.1 copper chaperone PCu(A)C [Aliikangiella marina]
MQFIIPRSIFIFCLMVMASLPALAESQKILVKDPIMPKLPEVARTAAIYMTIENTSDSDAEIIGVKTEVAHHTMIHKTVEKDGLAKMEHLDSVIIPAKGTLELKRGSYHIMLMGLDKKKLAKPFSLSLMFANGDPIQVEITPQR